MGSSVGPLVPPPLFQNLRRLAAGRRAHSMPGHVDLVVRKRTAVSMAVTLEAIDLTLRYVSWSFEGSTRLG